MSKLYFIDPLEKSKVVKTYEMRCDRIHNNFQKCTNTLKYFEKQVTNSTF